MSAFIVSHDHIDAILTFAIRKVYSSGVKYSANGMRVEITTFNATEVGRILLTENERSIYARYPDCRDTPDNRPGTIGEDAQTYTFRPWVFPADRDISPLSILKGCDCFDYQACETDDYEESLAHTIIDAIRSRAISTLPGLDNAPGWEFNRERTKAVGRG